MNTVTPQMICLLGQSERADIVEAVVRNFNEFSLSYGINSDLRACHFFAQAACESDDFHTLTEYASGAAYEWRTDLGNVQAGDGVKFKGRGIFQLTGRANYTSMGKKLGIDLVGNPELAATPRYATITALEYWKNHNLNDVADGDDIVEITHRINGGENGLRERSNYLRMMKSLIKGDLCMGVTDSSVKPYQVALKINADGAFGPGTEQTVRAFQLANKLPTTGVLDEATRNALVKPKV
jgi:putative chitinase